MGWVDPEKGIVLDEAINRLWSSDQLKQGCYTCPEVLSCFNLRCRKVSWVDGDYGRVACLRAKAVELLPRGGLVGRWLQWVNIDGKRWLRVLLYQ